MRFAVSCVLCFFALNALAIDVRSSSSGSGTTGSTTHTLTLPATIESGDLLVCQLVNQQIETQTWPAGWTEVELVSGGGGASSITSGVYMETAVGTEDGTDITVTTPNGRASAFTCYAVQDWAGTEGTDVETGTGLVGTDANPDPPSASPSWGSAEALFIAFAGHRDDTTTVSSYPANYADDQEDGASGGSTSFDVRALAATRILTTSSEDPGTYTLSASEGWVAHTVAIEGGAGGGTEIPTVLRRRRN